MTVLFRDDFTGSAGVPAAGWTSTIGGTPSLVLDGAGNLAVPSSAGGSAMLHTISVPGGAAWIEVEWSSTCGSYGEVRARLSSTFNAGLALPGNPGGGTYLETFYGSTGVELTAADTQASIAGTTGLSALHTWVMRITSGSPAVSLTRDGVLVGSMANSGATPMASLSGIESLYLGLTWVAMMDYIEVRDNISVAPPPASQFWTDFVNTYEVI